ncbi:MAG: nicotinamide-nucleotide adenylyltransferase [Desulfurococcaceae archaeon]
MIKGSNSKYSTGGTIVNRALFIGRFQPFHNGHLHAVKHILGEYAEVVIAIAAAQYNYTIDNPFTAGERVEMIRIGLGDLYTKSYIVPVDNITNNYEWPRYLLSYTPRVVAVFSNNEFTRTLFEAHGFRVFKTPELPNVSGSIIRRFIAEDMKWEHLVPEPVADFIVKINAVERLKTLWKLQVRAQGERF